MKVKLIEHTPNPDLIVATAAKLCYSQSDINDLLIDMMECDESKTEKFINMLTSAHHGSPMEHVSFIFAIENVSRITEQQLTRARIASYSIQSGRYVNRRNATFSVPPAIAKNPKLKAIYDASMERDRQAYEELASGLIEGYIREEIECNPKLVSEIIQHQRDTDRGKHMYEFLVESSELAMTYKKLYKKHEKKAFEDARYVFAGSLQTKIIVTMNARSLFNFFEHRCCKRAQWEIRELAFEMLKLCKEVAPMLFKNIGAPCMSGACKEGSMTCGKPYVKEVTPCL